MEVPEMEQGLDRGLLIIGGGKKIPILSTNYNLICRAPLTELLARHLAGNRYQSLDANSTVKATKPALIGMNPTWNRTLPKRQDGTTLTQIKNIILISVPDCETNLIFWSGSPRGKFRCE